MSVAFNVDVAYLIGGLILVSLAFARVETKVWSMENQLKVHAEDKKLIWTKIDQVIADQSQILQALARVEEILKFKHRGK